MELGNETVTLVDESGREHTIEYSVVVREIGEFGQEEYGVMVAGDGETINVTGITMDAKKICLLMKLLTRCGVTPVSLKYVIEDLL